MTYNTQPLEIIKFFGIDSTYFLSYHVLAKVAAPYSAYKTHTTHNFSIRSDKGLTPET